MTNSAPEKTLVAFFDGAALLVSHGPEDYAEDDANVSAAFVIYARAAPGRALARGALCLHLAARTTRIVRVVQMLPSFQRKPPLG